MTSIKGVTQKKPRCHTVCNILPVVHVVGTDLFDAVPGADLGFIKGGLTQGTNLLGRGVQSMLELGGLGACPPGKF